MPVLTFLEDRLELDVELVALVKVSIITLGKSFTFAAKYSTGLDVAIRLLEETFGCIFVGSMLLIAGFDDVADAAGPDAAAADESGVISFAFCSSLGVFCQ